ncbi:peptidoglycan DD-metalloendopeptidase family protein [Stackebrandtia nassauensis]|uniref:Peptidase M23 n=1 Tax=Stackebrandtia nassauensis (strain DSM 44728 / CIP 108903 / NRRL B-16338 / NBRC 102104 / LLR-40K-21) TaxID=446470 RepID=D3Q3K2_STANL|nr:peptidoglycan DD-metalloendopeptidase family protein [Stackebrandtia nassauensis]ADD42043.1 Peptidase M23 [Stackebrandtia nassauensis DSM 44728]
MERFNLPKTIAAVIAAITITVVGGGSTAVAAPPNLKDTVAATLVAEKADEARDSYGVSTSANLSTLVETKRTSADGLWAFGGAVLKVPSSSHASPVTALFFAQRTMNGWEVALKGTEEFAEAARQAPDDILRDEGERDVLAATAKPRTALAPTGLALPWANGQGGWRHWGVHGNSGTSRPYNSIDFYGGDGQVRAAAGGYLYRYCGTSTPLIEIEHDNGWTTGYYHTWNQTTVADGTKVGAYAYIGRIGEQLPCGGRANGDHVHWTLWQGNTAVTVNNKEIGGWTWHEQSQAYRGWASRNGVNIYNSDCCLTNYGPGSGTTTGRAHNPDGVVNVRTEPKANATVLRTIAHDTEVELECYVRGDTMTGPWDNTSDVWDRLPGGGYVSDAWLDTGSDEPIVDPC